MDTNVSVTVSFFILVFTPKQGGFLNFATHLLFPYIEDELVDVEPPPDMLYFEEDLAGAVSKYPPEYDTENCTEAVTSLFMHYCKTCYTDKEIVFFDGGCCVLR